MAGVDYAEPALSKPKPRWRASTVILAIALLLITIGWLEFRTSGGPLAAPDGTSSMIGVPANVGDPLSVGVDTPTYRGGGTLLIDSIVPDQVPDGLRVLGYGVLAWGQGGVGAVRSFPPEHHHLLPVAGAKVASGQALAVVVGLEPTKEGVFVTPGFTIHYHTGLHRYAAHYSQAIEVCAPMAGHLENCP